MRSSSIPRAAATLAARATTLAASATALAAAFAPHGAGAAEVAVSSPPVDYAIYRDGAVKRTDRRFGSWTLTCDEIASQARRFCTLRGLARAADGTIIASLAVSTDDGGRPAALVTLPFGTVLASGSLELKAGARPARLALRPALCDRQGCQVIWSLVADDIRALSAGAPLRVNFAMATPASTRIGLAAPARVGIEGALPTDGFADALRASAH